MEHVDVVIIGAGISGLTFGHYCKKRGLSSVILEKTSHVGGLVNSAQFDDFWVELGAHTCFNSYGHILDIMQDIDLINKINLRATKKFQFYKNQTVCSIPSQLHFFELFLNVWKLFSNSKENKTVKEYYQAIVGENNYHDVFQHAFNAVICQNAQDFPAELLFRKKPQNKQIARSFIFPNGIQTLPNTLAQHLDCYFNKNIQAIDFIDSFFEVKTEQHNHFQAKHLVIATPINVAGILLEQVAPRISVLLKEIPISTVESFAVKVPKDAIKLKPFAGLIGAEEDFYSVVSRDTLPDEKYRGFTFHFKAGRLDEIGKLQTIAKVLGISLEQILNKTNKINELPALNPKHKELIENVEKELQNQPLAIIGNYFQGVSLEDCTSRSFAEFNRLFG
jgi:protoporphyrinogen/coproporphyrinogen III oxidase